MGCVSSKKSTGVSDPKMVPAILSRDKKATPNPRTTSDGRPSVKQEKTRSTAD